MSVTKFAIPEIIFGRGAIIHVAQCASRLGAKKVLLVSDPGIERAGWVDRVSQILEDEKLGWEYYGDVNSNPRDFQVRTGALVYRETQAIQVSLAHLVQMMIQ